MTKKAQNKGKFSQTKMKVTATETSRKLEFDVPNNELDNVTAGLFAKNHQRGMYDEFFTLNQQFMLYVLTIGLKGREWEVFIWFLARMDYGNKILINQDLLKNELKLNQSQVSKALDKLRSHKIIIQTKYNTAKYEVSFNYDLLNPEMAFKGKASIENVKIHKDQRTLHTPYQKQINIEGNVDLVNGATGEIFNTITLTPTDRAKNIDNQQIPIEHKNLEDWQIEVIEELKEEKEEQKRKLEFKKQIAESGYLDF